MSEEFAASFSSSDAGLLTAQPCHPGHAPTTGAVHLSAAHIVNWC